ncbi:MAG: flagellar export chaperone FliS [Clostridia bacterium]|nr:flagellar export chaperone FliS [Clostridia bacterium]
MAIMNPYNYSKPKTFIATEPLKAVKPIENSRANPKNDKMDQYLENRIISAKPEELTLMLYEGLVKFIKKAQINLDTKNIEQVNYNVMRAQAIVDELRNTLNMEIPLSESMDSMYEYLSYKLVMANVDKNPLTFDEALIVAEDFRETWKEAFGLK